MPRSGKGLIGEVEHRGTDAVAPKLLHYRNGCDIRRTQKALAMEQDKPASLPGIGYVQ